MIVVIDSLDSPGPGPSSWRIFDYHKTGQFLNLNDIFNNLTEVDDLGINCGILALVGLSEQKGYEDEQFS